LISDFKPEEFGSPVRLLTSSKMQMVYEAKKKWQENND
jgi:hypothetical protein